MLKKIKSERLVWIDITITLLALCVMAYFSYGMRIIVLGGLCIAVSLAAELISLRLMHRKFTADDLSCTSDALIITLMMPAVIEYEIPAIACAFAVIAAKNIFGGRRNMIFSPAAAAYVFMLTSWKKELLSYPEPYAQTGVLEKTDELFNSASYTFNHTGSMNYSDFEILLGSFCGPIGTVSILLLLVSAIVLLFRRDISFGAFTGTILGTVFMAYFCPVSGSGFDSVKYVLSTNMILFSAIYIISDLRIAPKKDYYAFFYGFFIAISSYVVMLTTGKENVIVIMSVLFTPFSLALKNLQKKIDIEIAAEGEAALQSEKASASEDDSSVTDEADETETDTESGSDNGNVSDNETDSENNAASSDEDSEGGGSLPEDEMKPEGDESDE